MYRNFILNDYYLITCYQTEKGTCGDGMFPCSLPGSSIPRRYVCDGQKDCNDGADETKELCGNYFNSISCKAIF